MDIIENNSPVYLQIAEKLMAQIFGGELAVGKQIPTVREIALAERVNPNTVQRALEELERERLILSQGTSGNFVTMDIELIMQKREEYAKNLTKTYEEKMRAIGAEVTMPKVLWMPENKERSEIKSEQKRKRERRKWFF